MNNRSRGAWDRCLFQLRWFFMSPRARYAVLWNRTRDHWE